MTQVPMPRVSEDVLTISGTEMPDIIRTLVRERQLSPLIARIHGDLRSGNPALQRQGKLALRRLGFLD